jgi:hypothetical protein
MAVCDVLHGAPTAKKGSRFFRDAICRSWLKADAPTVCVRVRYKPHNTLIDPAKPITCRPRRPMMGIALKSRYTSHPGDEDF